MDWMNQAKLILTLASSEHIKKDKVVPQCQIRDQICLNFYDDVMLNST